MRQLSAWCWLLLCCGLAFSQEQWIPPGTYSEPFAPRIATPAAPAEALITPSLTFESPSLVVGASSYTGSPTGSSVVFNQPVSYDPGVQFSSPFYPSPNATAPEESAARSGLRPFNSGAARFQSSYGVAQLMGNQVRRKAVRVYTNPDIARLNNSNGMIRYGGASGPTWTSREELGVFLTHAAGPERTNVCDAHAQRCTTRSSASKNPG